MSDQRQDYTDAPYVHFTTFSVFKCRRLLDLEEPKRIVLKVLNRQLLAMHAKCAGYVVMPDHVHALVWLQKAGGLRRFLHGWKRMSSFEIRRWYEAKAPNYFAEVEPGDHFWQAKNYTFHIESEHKLRQKLDYLHLNPVRAGLVNAAVDWRWSSARWYLRDELVDVPVSWIEL